MTKGAVEAMILQVEADKQTRCQNICSIITSAIYGLVGFPCCLFFGGCCGSFPAAPMVPEDTGVQDAIARLPRGQKREFNTASHLEAWKLGMCGCVDCCGCCGMCGTYGPYGTAEHAGDTMISVCECIILLSVCGGVFYWA